LLEGLVFRTEPQWGLELIRPSFDDKTWAAFWRTTVDGRTSAEVGEELGMSNDAVRQAKRRVRRRFQQEFDWLM
jgi:RNA polymerase sigma-70 factor (ECF subfamily)